jgi:hypothetical protein
MITLSRICLALLAGALACAVRAQEAPPRTVTVKARTNPGDLPYEWVYNHQRLLQGAVPAEPRMVDFTWRITFVGMSEPEQDDYVPKGWAVALVGSGFERDVPVARGGYFLLPELPLGRQSSTIMFKEQSLQNYIGGAWRVRVGPDQRLSYAGVKQAIGEIQSVQNAIPLRYAGLDQLRTARYDGLKACFVGADGAILIDGKPAADASFGHCSLLKFDPAKADGGQTIEFKGPLDLVTIVESDDYLAMPPSLSLAARAQADLTSTDEAPLDTALHTAPTNLSNLSYGWVFKHQSRLQGLRTPDRKVDFVWRLSFSGMSDAERDAWVPQGWAVALAGKGFAQALPVARGGYFLLPALPAGRQSSTLVFKEQGRQNLVEPAWVVRLHNGQRPYIHYGEIKEAMNAVRKAQDEIPDGHAELAAVRDGHYDGVKACFLGEDGIVFVGDTPTFDATVGHCRILKFDPRQDVNRKIEFVGPLDAVTMVDTARYLKPRT